MPHRKPSYSDAIQIVLMLRMLAGRSSRSMRVNEIAERLEVSRKTVLRYADAIAGAICSDDGEALVSRELRNGEAWLQMAREPSPLSSGIYQYAAVWAASRWLTAGRGSLLGDTVETALECFEGKLAGNLAPLVDRVATAFHYVPFGPKDYRVNEDALDALVQATLRQHPVTIERRRRDGTVHTELLEPFTLVMYRDGLYVLGRFVGYDELWLFAVERILSAEVDRSSTFTLPEGFDPEAHFAGRLGLWEPAGEPVSIEVAFQTAAGEAAALRSWPGFQRWRRAQDGRDVLELKLPVSPEVVTWIASWGSQAEVLKPKSLRDRVVEELKGALAQYETEAP